MTYPVKIEYKEYPSGSWANWSDYLVEAPTINRKVESDNEGEAGVIVFDNAQITLRCEPGNPVYIAFSGDLTDKQRYLFRISAPKKNKSYVRLFEGIADFSSVIWPGDQNLISFDIIDKLSALGVLPSRQAREQVDYYDLIGTTWQSWYLFQFGPDNIPVKCFITYQHLVNGVMQYADIPPGHPFQVGRIIKHPEDFTDGLNNTDSRFFLITKIDTDTANGHTALSLTIMSNGVAVNNSTTYTSLPVFDHLFYSADINIINAGTLIAYDGIKIIEGIIKQQWPEITTINKFVNTIFSVPLEYFSHTVDENPLGTDPLQALKTLADSMRCYIYINNTGNLVIQSKDNLAVTGIARSLNNTKVLNREKKYFWDKLVDGVTIKVKSWVLDENGEYLEGLSTLSKELTPGSNTYLSKPKNEITKELLADSSDTNTQEKLDFYANTMATEYLAFYGLRRSAYNIVLKLDDNTIDWELVDNLMLDSARYFFTSIEMDLVEKTVTISPVEVEGHEFDFRQVLVGLSESNSTSVSSGSYLPGIGGSGISAAYTFTLPLYLYSGAVSIQNLKVDAPNIFSQRNGTNPQEYRLYNSYTDSINNEFISLGFKKNSNLFTIETEKAGSGVIRNIAINGGNIGIGTNSPSAKLEVAGRTLSSVIESPYFVSLNSPYGGFGFSSNYLASSEDFNGAGWSSANVVKTSNTLDLAAPNGTYTATKLVFSSGEMHSSFGTGSSIQNKVFTFSIWLRTASGTNSQTLIMRRADASYTAASQEITITSEWKRFYIIGTFDSSTLQPGRIDIRNGSDGTIYAWGAQVSQTNIIGPYVPTTGETATSTLNGLVASGSLHQIGTSNIVRIGMGAAPDSTYSLYGNFNSGNMVKFTKSDSSGLMLNAGFANVIMILNNASGGFDSSTGKTGFTLRPATTGKQAGIFVDNQDGHKLKFRVGGNNDDNFFTGSDALIIDATANVGIATTDLDGVPAVGRLTIKGSTNNGTTNILVGRNSSENNVFLLNTSGDILSPNYVSQLTGWKVTGSGNADFRYLYTDELHAKSFIADLEQALAGSQIICKSVAKVAVNLTLPFAGNSVQLIVESFGGFETASVFQNGDLVRLRQFSRSSGSLDIADAWGTVVLDTSYGSSGFNTLLKTQAYIFTRHASVPGSAAGVIKEGTLALDYGVSGNGFIESNAIDGAWAINSPYTQIVTWAANPGNYTIHKRTGKLTGITDNDFGGSLPSNFGTYINGSAFIKGNIYVKASNPLALQNNSIMIGNITGAAANAIKISNTGATSTSGILLYDSSSQELLKFALDGTRHIANWSFDKDKFYKVSGNNKFALNTSSIPYLGNLQTGFEVWDISSPKILIGSKDSSGNLSKGFDWNFTTADEMTIKATILASRFTTKAYFGDITDTTTAGVDITSGTTSLYFYDQAASNYRRIRMLANSGLIFAKSSDGINYSSTINIDCANPAISLNNGKLSLFSFNSFNGMNSSDTFTIGTENASGSKLILSPDGDLILNPASKNIFPENDFDINLGSASKKFLSLYASELVVQSLVAQNVMATIGGRILVAPTNKLIANLSASGSNIDVKYNNFNNGDRIYFEGNGNVEFMAVNSSATTIIGGYRYSVTRNLDGTGANIWNSGDAVVNVGSHFIDIYSNQGVKGASQSGPTIVGNVRNSPVYNDWSEFWAIGNLAGLYGNSLPTFGVGLGRYANNSSFVQIDSAGGISFKYKSSSSISTIANWSMNGDITVGEVGSGKSNVFISSGAVKLRNNTLDMISLDTSGNITVGRTSGKNIVIDSNSIKLRTGSTEYLAIDDSVTPFMRIGQTGAGQSHIYLDSGFVKLRNNATDMIVLDSTGIITVGEIAVSKSNIQISSGAVKLRNNITDIISLSTSGTLLLGQTTAGQSNISIDTGQIKLRNTTTDLIVLDSSGNILVGRTGLSQSNIYITAGAIQLRNNVTEMISLDTAGVITVGEVGTSKSNIQISSGAVKLRNNTADMIILDTSGTISVGEVGVSKSNIQISSGAVKLRNNLTDMISLSASGILLLGQTGSGQSNISIDSGQIKLRNTTTDLVVLDTSGNILVGRTGVNQSNVYITAGAILFRNNLTEMISLDTAGIITVGEVGVSKSNIQISSGAVKLRNNLTDMISLSATGTLLLGQAVAGQSNISIDSGQIKLRNTTTDLVVLDTSGNILVGRTGVSQSNIYITAGSIKLRNNITDMINLDASGLITVGSASGKNIVINNDSVKLRISSTDYLVIDDSVSPYLRIGQVGANKSNVYIDSGVLKLRTNTTDIITLDTSGIVTVGEVAVSKSNIQISSGAVKIRNNTTDILTLDASGIVTAGELGASKSNIQISSGVIRLRNNTTDMIVLDGTGNISVGEVGASKSNIQISSGVIRLRNNTTDMIVLDGTGNISVGEVGVSKSNIQISSGTVKLRNNTADMIILDSAGIITVGEVGVSKSNIQISSGSVKLRNNAADMIILDSAGVITFGEVGVSKSNIQISSGSVKLRNNLTDMISLSASGTLLLGQTGSGQSNISIDSGQIKLRNTTTDLIVLDTSGNILVGKTGVNQSNIYINAGAIQLRNNITPVISLNSDGTGSFAGNISSSATITGGTFQTAASGQRITLNGADNKITFYGSSGSSAGSLYGFFDSHPYIQAIGEWHFNSDIYFGNTIYIGNSLIVSGVVSLFNGLSIDGNVYLNNNTNKYLTFGASGVASPGTNSNGTKIILYGNTEDDSNSPRYGFGIASSELWYSSAGAHKWYNESSGFWTPLMDLSNSGILNVTGQYKIDGIQVLTNRLTGWAAASGIATRTSFATSAVTLQQLAERVKALLDDLITHGLIGS